MMMEAIAVQASSPRSPGSPRISGDSRGQLRRVLILVCVAAFLCASLVVSPIGSVINLDEEDRIKYLEKKIERRAKRQDLKTLQERLTSAEDAIHALNFSATTAMMTRKSGPSTLQKDSHLLTIVSACSENHFFETVAMLKTLIKTKCTAPVVLYLMYAPGEVLSHSMTVEFRQELAKSPLDITVIEYQVMEDLSTYCFKPRVMQDYLFHTSSRPKALMWADSSTRFQHDPNQLAQAMLRDNVDFTANTARGSNMVDFVHPDTYTYLNASSSDYTVEIHDIHAAAFLVNLERAQEAILAPWFDCGIRACMTCMAPPGSYKFEPKFGMVKAIDNTTILHKHRQDQAALSVIVYEWQRQSSMNAHVQLNNSTYMNVWIDRGAGEITSVTQLNDA